MLARLRLRKVSRLSDSALLFGDPAGKAGFRRF